MCPVSTEDVNANFTKEAKSRMETERIIMVIGSDSPPEVEEEWSEWYNREHTPDALKFKGIRKGVRYRLVDSATLNVTPTPGGERVPKYLAVYEFESREALKEWDTSPERQHCVDEWTKKWSDKGPEIGWRLYYEPILDLRK